MKKDNILNMLMEFSPYDSKEKHDLDKTIIFFKKNQKWFSKKNIEGHVTASAWIINKKRTHCLLMHHKKLNRWLQLGGHIETDFDLHDAALREAIEESGIMNLVLFKRTIFDLDVHIIPALKTQKEHYHYDFRFLFISEHDTYKKNLESNKLEWVPIDRIPLFTDDQSLLRMAKKTKPAILKMIMIRIPFLRSK
jgi:8-oxo-dGTP pyrophosphatase MutT (NUDIX family)